MFQNRTEAGQLLAVRLKAYHARPDVILAVPRGGVPVACQVANILHIPLDLLLIKKLGHPMSSEYAIGAVGLDNQFIVPHEEVPQSYIERETANVRARLQDMRKKFMVNKEAAVVTGKTVIIIDDGIATGNTLMAAIQVLRKSKPAKIVVAVPVASQSAVNKIAPEVDKLMVVLIPQHFHGVGKFYKDFTQVTDEEVLACLNKLDDGLKKAC